MIDCVTLQRAAGISESLALAFLHPITDVFAKSQIDTPLRQAHFLGQVTVESGGFQHVEESFNYSCKALHALFGNRLTQQQCDSLGRHDGAPALSQEQQKAIANIVYANRYGNDQPGDGWKYRGRGLLQTTFKANYQACSKYLNVDAVSLPELLTTPDYATLSAGYFWLAKGCNELADQNDVVAVSKRINGGTNGLEQRIAATKHALDILG